MGVSMFGHDEDNQNGQTAVEPTQDQPIDNGMSNGDGMPQDQPGSDPASAVPAGAPSAPMNKDALLDLKRDALSQLAPLVGHLDQSPEEKFKTTMMMIQATDDSTLIKEAYEADKQIGDDKARAQSLLDIVNEINYFTQQHNAEQ